MTTQGPSRPSAIAIASLERQLKVAQQITRIGSWEWDVTTNTVTWSDELYRICDLPPGTPMTLEAFLVRVHPDDRRSMESRIEQAIENGGRFTYSERIVRPDGSVRELDSACEVAVEDGRAVRLVGTCRDVTEDRQRERTLQRVQRLEVGERNALELLAAGASMHSILRSIALLVESLIPGSAVSVLIVDETATSLRTAAAPSLEDAYNALIDHTPIGPTAGSCGTAAFRRERVIVRDIETDPLWASYRHWPQPFGLRACWSSPLIGSQGSVLGTFAVYYREPRAPDNAALDVVARASHIAGIVIERRQLDDQLRALAERTEGIREDERTRIAREVHDELGQSLTALKMDIAWVARRVDNAAVAAKLGEMSTATDEVIASVRRISAEFRPGILDDLGLEAAIEWQLDELARRTGLVCQLDSTLGESRLERALATTVFRICQEALTNVVRHAKASTVEVALRVDDGKVELEVADDGVGMPERASRIGSLGLLGMSERVRRLGGVCEVRRRAAGGTVVAVQIPMRAPGVT